MKILRFMLDFFDIATNIMLGIEEMHIVKCGRSSRWSGTGFIWEATTSTYGIYSETHVYHKYG